MPAMLSAAPRFEHDLIDHLVGLPAGKGVMVAHDGKNETLAGGGGEISGENVDVIERAGFGAQQGSGRKGLEARPQGSIHSGKRQAVDEFRAPGLAGRITQQLHRGVGRDQVQAGESGAVVEGVFLRRQAGLGKKSAQYFESAGHRAAGAFLASQQAQQHFGMKILAHLVDDADIHAERRRIVLGEDHGLRASGERAQSRRHRLQGSIGVARVAWCAEASFHGSR